MRGAAAYKAALCLQDPHDHGPRRWLNLGHTFGHALEAAADFDLPHGEAVALGLLAALRLSRPRHGAGRARARAEAGARRSRARLAGAAARQEAHRRRINLVLLGDGGPVVEPRDPAEVRRELERLIA